MASPFGHVNGRCVLTIVLAAIVSTIVAQGIVVLRVAWAQPGVRWVAEVVLAICNHVDKQPNALS